MTRVTPFSGYPASGHATLVPNLFFSELLPEIEDPAELVVTTYLFFAIGRKRAAARWIAVAELAAEPALQRPLARLPGGAAAAFARGLEAAISRQSIVRVRVDGQPLVTLNGAPWRRMLPEAADLDAPLAVELLAPERPPSIYALYEETIGTISPLIADELRAADEDYPEEWIVAAFREAVSLNRRSWRYVSRILERWRDEGRTDAAVGRVSDGQRDLAGRYRDFVRG